jgi:nucleoside 2-deoxyribosyltransferase
MNDPISWKHVTVYLSGPMEFAKDGGVEWRREIEQRLRDNLGIQESNILNPCDKPNVYGFRSLADEIAVQHTLREKEDWAELDKTMKRIMTIDLRLVDRSDIVIAYLPADTKMAGTIHEIVVARGQKKPVVAIVPHGMKSMSGWMMALIGHRR